MKLLLKIILTIVVFILSTTAYGILKSADVPIIFTSLVIGSMCALILFMWRKQLFHSKPPK